MTNKKLYYFNPTCEMAVANGSPYYQPPQLLSAFEEALSTITICLANESDFLVRENPISNLLKANLQMLGCPNVFASKKENILELLKNQESKVSLSPWGWSPALINFFRDFRPYLTNLLPEIDFKEFYGRKNAILLLNKIASKVGNECVIPSSLFPKAVHTEFEVESMLSRWEQIVLKAPLSSSGRGLLVVRKASLNQSNKQWIATILKSQGYLVAEPLLDKVIDFSYQYKIDKLGEVDYLGTTFFETNSNGQYQGHHLNSLPAIMSEKAFLSINDTINRLGELIKEELAQSMYKKQAGYLGVDALIYKNGYQLAIHPVVEINPRNNMGIISMQLAKMIHPETQGYYRVYSERKRNYSDFEREQRENYPPIMRDGKLLKGFLSLTETRGNQQFGAYIIL